VKVPHVAAQLTKQDDTVQPVEHELPLEHPAAQLEPQSAQPPRPHPVMTAHPAETAESADEHPTVAAETPATASAAKTAPSDFCIGVHPTRPWDAPGNKPLCRSTKQWAHRTR
jgi:hypothetical protein